jgi:S1-C subfamily serine protease
MGLLRRRSLPVEGVKLLVLAAGFWLLLEHVRSLHGELDLSRQALAAQGSLQQKVVNEDIAGVQRVLDQTEVQLLATNAKLEDCLVRLEGQRLEMADLVERRTEILQTDLEASIDYAKLGAERARSAVEKNTVRLAELGSRMTRDVDWMKHRMIQPTVQLRGSGTVGSGVVVYSERQEDGEEAAYTTLVLTAHHVVLEVLGGRQDMRLLREVQVFDSLDGTADTQAAQLVAFDRDRDIALLRLNSTRRFPYVAELISTADLHALDVFTRAYAVGCPLGNRPLPTVGEISSKRKIVGDQRFWMINAPTFFGNSGGGVYLAENCHLIGVSSMIYTYGKTHPTVVPHMGLFVPMDVIYSWLDSEDLSFVHRRERIPPVQRSRLVFSDSTASL